MTEKRLHKNPVEIAFFCLAGMVGIIAAVLTIFVEQYHDESVLLLFYPLMPGLIAGLLITGGHGGTAIQEKVAAVLAVLVNAASYVSLILVARWVWRTLIARPTAYAAIRETKGDNQP